jgi:hypothetical protein
VKTQPLLRVVDSVMQSNLKFILYLYYVYWSDSIDNRVVDFCFQGQKQKYTLANPGR